MTNLWEVRIGKDVVKLTAERAKTAVFRVLDDPVYHNTEQGTINFKLLHGVKRVKCEVCGIKYDDWPEGKKYHEDSWYHKQKMEEQGK